MAQHLDKDYTIALPLVKNNRSNYLVIEYKGEEAKRFYYLIQHLFKSLNILDYHLYQGKDEQRLQVFIEVENISVAEADTRLNKISHALKQKMPIAWKCLPSSTLPEAYNIVTLPYKKKATKAYSLLP